VQCQAALLLRVAAALVAGGLPATALGAISPYRAQVRVCGAVRGRRRGRP